MKAVDVVPQQYVTNGAFQKIVNAIMIVVAVAAFVFVGFPFSMVSTDKGDKIAGIFSNIMVTLIAFPVNVSVFETEIRLVHIFDELQGWHSFWTGCAILQILTLSGLGAKLLKLAQSFLNLMSSAVKKGLQFSNKIPNIVKGNKFIFVCMIIWIVYMGIQIYSHGLTAAFSGTDIFSNSLQLWITVIIICFLAYIVPSALKKAREAINHTAENKVLVVWFLLAFLSLASFFPPLLRIIGTILLAVMTPVSLIWLTVRLIQKRRTNQGSNGKGSWSAASGSVPIHMQDLAVVLTLFIVIPLVLLCAITVFQGGRDLTALSKDITSWLAFLKAVSETAKTIVEPFIQTRR